MGSGRILVVLIALILGACSVRSTIDALSSPEDRAFAQDFVAKVRRGDVKSLEPRFNPRIWSASQAQFASAPGFYPPTEGTTELIGYQVHTDLTGGAATRRKNYTLVTHDSAFWTTTVIQTLSDHGGPELIVGWQVGGGPEMPPAYRQYRSMEAAVPWIRGGAAVGLLAAIGLVVWLARRSRRRRAERQGVGTP